MRPKKCRDARNQNLEEHERDEGEDKEEEETRDMESEKTQMNSTSLFFSSGADEFLGRGSPRLPLIASKWYPICDRVSSERHVARSRGGRCRNLVLQAHYD